jgi:hypothetical protein
MSDAKSNAPASAARLVWKASIMVKTAIAPDAPHDTLIQFAHGLTTAGDGAPAIKEHCMFSFDFKAPHQVECQMLTGYTDAVMQQHMQDTDSSLTAEEAKQLVRDHVVVLLWFGWMQQQTARQICKLIERATLKATFDKHKAATAVSDDDYKKRICAALQAGLTGADEKQIASCVDALPCLVAVFRSMTVACPACPVQHESDADKAKCARDRDVGLAIASSAHCMVAKYGIGAAKSSAAATVNTLHKLLRSAATISDADRALIPRLAEAVTQSAAQHSSVTKSND